MLEDSPADAEAMIMRLKEDGFEPEWQRFETPAELVSRLTPSVDIILADYHLPGFTAVDLLRQLRDVPGDVPPVIVVSGMLGDEAAVDVLQDGAADYVLKDRMARLAPAVDRALKERSLRVLKREAEERLRESEKLMLSMLHAIEDVIWSTRLPSRELLFINPSVSKLFGRPAREFLNGKDVWRDAVHAEDRAVFDEGYAQAMKWGFSEAEYRILRPDGKTRWVRSRTWVAYQNGSAYRAEGVIADITATREGRGPARTLPPHASLEAHAGGSPGAPGLGKGS